MFQIQIIDTQNVFIFSKFTIPLSRQHIIVLKLKLKLSSSVLFLECFHERFKTFFEIFLNI